MNLTKVEYIRNFYGMYKGKNKFLGLNFLKNHTIDKLFQLTVKGDRK